MTHRAGLAERPPPLTVQINVELALALGGDERLLQDHLQHRPREIGDVVLAVDGDLAGALLDPDAGDGVLALAGGIGAALGVELLLIDAGLAMPQSLSPLSGPRSSSVLTSGLAMALGAPCILAC